MVLRDSFLASDKVKIIMLACVCPGISSSDHTLNTLRYAERLKERPIGSSNYQSRQNEESGNHQRRANSSLPPEQSQFQLESKANKPKQSPFGLKAMP
jgi:kinesin family protein 2/24